MTLQALIECCWISCNIEYPHWRFIFLLLIPVYDGVIRISGEAVKMTLQICICLWLCMGVSCVNPWRIRNINKQTNKQTNVRKLNKKGVSLWRDLTQAMSKWQLLSEFYPEEFWHSKSSDRHNYKANFVPSVARRHLYWADSFPTIELSRLRLDLSLKKWPTGTLQIAS